MATKFSFSPSPSIAPSCSPPDKWTGTPAPPVNRISRALHKRQPQKGNPHECQRTSETLLMPPHQEPIWHFTAECRVMAPRCRFHLDLLVPAHHGPGGPGRALRPFVPLHALTRLLRMYRHAPCWRHLRCRHFDLLKAST